MLHQFPLETGVFDQGVEIQLVVLQGNFKRSNFLCLFLLDYGICFKLQLIDVGLETLYTLLYHIISRVDLWLS